MSDPNEALRVTRVFMRGLANRLVEGASQPNAVDCLVVLHSEIADFIEARRAQTGDAAPIDPNARVPKILPREVAAYFEKPRSAYEYAEDWVKSYESVRKLLSQAVKVGDLYPAGHRAPTGPGRPAQLYTSDRLKSLWARFQEAQQSED